MSREVNPRLGAPRQSRDLATRRRLCQVSWELHARGWCLGTSGNFSTVLTREPFRLLITPSGRNKQALRPQDLLVVGPEGQLVDGSAGIPSAETLPHCTIAAQAGAGSTLHIHSVASTLLGERFLPQGGFTLSGYEMLKGLEGVDTHEAKIFVPVLTNSQDMRWLSGQIRDLLHKRPDLHGFLIAGHGLYTWGENLEQAQRHVEIFEFLLECAARRTRFTPLEG